MPKISIMMPLYNKQRFVGRAIESVLKQIFQEYELLIINDCSTDASLEIAQSFTDPRIKIIKLDKNRGVSHAMNVGIKESKSELVARIDADDVYDPRKLSLQFKAIDGRDVVCHTDGFTLDANDNILRVGGLDKLKDKDPLVETLKQTDALMVKGSMMFRRDSAIEVGMFDESLFVREDTDFLLKMARKKQFVYVPEPLYGYRLAQTGLMYDANKLNKIKSYRIMQKVLERHIGINRDRIQSQDLPAVMDQLAMSCIAGRDYRSMAKYLLSNRLMRGPLLSRLLKHH